MESERTAGIARSFLAHGVFKKTELRRVESMKHTLDDGKKPDDKDDDDDDDGRWLLSCTEFNNKFKYEESQGTSESTVSFTFIPASFSPGTRHPRHFMARALPFLRSFFNFAERQVADLVQTSTSTNHMLNLHPHYRV